MGNKNTKINEAFFNAYLSLDKICAQKFSLTTGGVTEYINRLINARYAPGRDEVLPRLVKYRNIKNRIALDEGATADILEVKKRDIAWIRDFEHDVVKRRDSISVYIRTARRNARRRRFMKVFWLAFFIVAVIAAIVFFFVMK